MFIIQGSRIKGVQYAPILAIAWDTCGWGWALVFPYSVSLSASPIRSKALSNAFERIGDAEKNQWQPYYYAALTQVNAGTFSINQQTMMAGGNEGIVDPIADKAETLLQKAEALSANNSEIFVVKKLIATLRMMANPMSRYMQYGPKAAEALAMAKKLNPANPRVYLLEGQDQFYTPEEFGGSKAEAKKSFEEALKKFDALKPANTIEPTWGRPATQYYLSQIK